MKIKFLFSMLVGAIFIVFAGSQMLFALDKSDIYNGYVYPNAANKQSESSVFKVNKNSANVDPSTGDLKIHYTDLLLKGKNGMDLSLERYYSLSDSKLKEHYVGPAVAQKVGTKYKVYGQISIIKLDASGTVVTPRYTEPFNDNTYYNTVQEADNAINSYKSGIYDGYKIVQESGQIYYLIISFDGSSFYKQQVTVTQTVDTYGTKPWSNTNNDRYSVLGNGWYFNFPYIERRDEFEYLHFGTSGTWQIKITQDTNDSNLKDYLLKDIVIDADNGTYTNGEKYSKYVVKQKDGRKTFFDSNGGLIGVQDRFGNEIKFYNTYRQMVDYNNKTYHYPVLSKILDSVGRAINITNDAVNNIVTVSVADPSDPNNTKTLTYKRKEIYNITNNTRHKGEYILEKFTDANGQDTTYDYEYKYSIESLIYKNIEHYNDPAKVYCEGVYNYYAAISKITYPTGGKTRFEYNPGIKYDDGNGTTFPDTPISGVVPDKTMKNCGTEGSMYYCRINRIYDENKANKVYNAKQYQYNYIETGDSTNDVYQYDGYPKYSKEEDIPADHKFKTCVTDSLGNNEIYKYNKKLLCEDYLQDGTNHRERTITEYDLPKKLVKKIIKNIGNKETGSYIQVAENFDYNDYGDLVGYWDSQAKRDDNLNPTDGNEHKTIFTYHNIYNYLTSKIYKMDSKTTIKEEYIPSALNTGKTIQWAKVYVNGEIKKQTWFNFDSSGNMIEERRYLDNWTDYNTIRYDFTDNNSTRNNKFDGAYLTRVCHAGIKDTNGKLVEAKSGNSPGTIDEVYKYDWFGNMTEKQDGMGFVIKYGYDKLGRLTLVTYPDKSFKQWNYVSNQSENSLELIAENGNQTKSIYDEFGNLVNNQLYIKNPTTGVKEYVSISNNSYDTESRLDTETNLANGTVTKYTYLSDGRPDVKEVKDKNGKLLSKVDSDYDDANDKGDDGLAYFKKVTQTIIGDTSSPSIKTVAYTNKYGFLEKQERLHGTKTYKNTYKNNYLGKVTEEKDARAYDEAWTNQWTTKYDYDFEGRVVKTYNVEGNSFEMKFDSLGRVSYSTDLKGIKKTFSYDGMDRLIEERTPLEYKDAQAGQTTWDKIKKYSYDRNGNTKSERVTKNKPGASEEYREVKYGYNNRNRLTAVKTINFDGNSSYMNFVEYFYDESGNKLRMYSGLNDYLDIFGLDNVASRSDSDYTVTKYNYNEFDKLVKITDPKGGDISYKYDLNGNVTEEIDRNKNTIVYGYDGLGRLETKTVTPPDNKGIIAITQKYTLTGKISSKSNSSYNSSMTYDDLGRLITESETDDVTKKYEYDAVDNKKSFELAQAGKIITNLAYKYDAMNRLYQVFENSTTLLATYLYDANGNRDSLEYPNGLFIDLDYNLTNKLTSLTNTKGGLAGTVLSKYTYKYFLDGNQSDKTEVMSNNTVSYKYDGVGRLLSETEKHDGVDINSIIYSYDDFNNRSCMEIKDFKNNTSSLTTYVYDDNNRLRLETLNSDGYIKKTHYSYDNNGNMIYRSEEPIISGSSGVNGKVSTYVAETGTGTGQIASFYQYNALNQLIKSNTHGFIASYSYNSDGLRKAKWSNEVNNSYTGYVWDGQNLVLEIGDLGSVKNRYVRGVNLIYWETGTTRSYYLFNGHGDVVQLTDSSGNVTKTYDYDAFGQDKEDSSLSNNPFKYCGEYWDKETNTYYLRARYYDQGIGRFISEDSYLGNAADPLSLNLYTYSHNNPILFVDPSGHITQEEAMDLCNKLSDKDTDDSKPLTISVVKKVKLLSNIVKIKTGISINNIVNAQRFKKAIDIPYLMLLELTPKIKAINAVDLSNHWKLRDFFSGNIGKLRAAKELKHAKNLSKVWNVSAKVVYVAGAATELQNSMDLFWGDLEYISENNPEDFTFAAASAGTAAAFDAGSAGIIRGLLKTPTIVTIIPGVPSEWANDYENFINQNVNLKRPGEALYSLYEGIF